MDYFDENLFFEKHEIFVNERPYIISYEYPQGWLYTVPSMIKAMIQVKHSLDFPLTMDKATLIFEKDKSLLVTEIRNHVQLNQEKFKGVFIKYEFGRIGFGLNPEIIDDKVISIFSSIKATIDN